jgi:hypothetical protein
MTRLSYRQVVEDYKRQSVKYFVDTYGDVKLKDTRTLPDLYNHQDYGYRRGDYIPPHISR